MCFQKISPFSCQACAATDKVGVFQYVGISKADALVRSDAQNQ